MKDLGVDNKEDIIIGDYFLISYYGVNVILCVSKTDFDRVAVYECATTKVWKEDEGKYVDVYDRYHSYPRHPLLVTDNNTFYKTEFWVETCWDNFTNLPQLKVWIGENSPLYEKSKAINEKLGKNVLFLPGYWYASSMEYEKKKGIVNFCFATLDQEVNKRGRKKQNTTIKA